MKDFITANILLVNFLLIMLWIVPILHALHSKDSFETKILNIIMMVILPVLGSLIYCVKRLVNRLKRTNDID